MAEPAEMNSIDQAIQTCDKYIDEHRRSANRMLMLLVQIGVIVLTGLIGFGYVLFRPLIGTPEQAVVSPLFSNTVIFSLLAIFALVFGVLMSVYRFHLNETSKAEHYRIGFMRIRIAANNNSQGFQSEVRHALTEKAFAFQSSTGMFRGKNIESPLPGHPTSDVAAIILDKLLDKLELIEKKIEK
ncbi:MAG: hypothetical protein HY799_03650 [Nitrosomonadales bacterium]|nr:hypothetical protein [Nitrosomonadales bacterium]